ncbi:hypothetical protein DFO45_1911 [Azorhizobium sp. AG788]|nr:hypothetical protein DFO45_1911 [Azorhizobium sp. AG788]
MAGRKDRGLGGEDSPRSCLQDRGSHPRTRRLREGQGRFRDCQGAGKGCRHGAASGGSGSPTGGSRNQGKEGRRDARSRRQRGRADRRQSGATGITNEFVGWPSPGSLGWPTSVFDHGRGTPRRGSGDRTRASPGGRCCSARSRRIHAEARSGAASPSGHSLRTGNGARKGSGPSRTAGAAASGVSNQRRQENGKMTKQEFRASRKRKSCSGVASARARHRRARAEGTSPMKGEILFGVTWISSFMAAMSVAPFVWTAAWLRPWMPKRDAEPPHEPHPRELGVPGPLRPGTRGVMHGRYRSVPSMSLIMRDLKRPVAHDAARAALMARLGSDPATRKWAAAQIDGDEMRRLALHVRPGRSDVDVMAAWCAEAAAERAASEAEVAAAMRARTGAANAVAQDGSEGDRGAPAAPRIR